ncbi:MAG TPA: rubrerythrin family protein [Desulfobacterales bacterium]|nr:rubrerythrin family protein [Desulfobacterales bacterium]
MLGGIMSNKTEKNLAFAFAAESKAAARNSVFAIKAKRDGYPQFSHLFKAVAEAESVHARRYLRLMRGKIGTTEENLESAFKSEIKAYLEEYPRLIKEASEEGMDVPKKAFSESRDVENRHAELYKSAINDLLSDRISAYYVCQICGYISEAKAPEKCPVCGAIKEKFKEIE